MSPKPRKEPEIFEHVTTWIGSTLSFTLHTLAFLCAFLIGLSGIASWNTVLLVLTTVVSLEAIYLSIFIQMTVNRQSEELAEVSEDVEDIQEDIDEIQEDMDEVQKDVDEIQGDIGEIQEDVEDFTEEKAPAPEVVTLEQLTIDVRRVLADLEALKEGR
ncbi:MAG: hypothetical protein WDN10_00360 [bacterium]